jgi:hypothetical protein
MKRLCSDNIGNLANEMLNETYFLGSMFELQNKLKVNLKNLEGINEYAHELTVEEFKNEVENGLFIDDDGYGYYATETTKSDIYVYPSDFTENIYRDDFTHIIWFNR